MASRNGASTLPLVLEAYRRLIPPPQGWRLLIVDNGSTDATPALIARYAGRLPLQCLHEPEAGKNRALNRALAHLLRQPGMAEDLFIFTDDDAEPEPDWLLQWQTCADQRAGFSIFGGAILPRWQAPPPDWLLRLAPLGLTYGLTAASDGPVFPGLVWGANMAIRRGVFAAGHRFDQVIGPNGGSYAMGSETELTRRLSLAGYRSWFCCAARVAHHIRPQQVSLGYVLAKAWRFGRGQYRQDQPGRFPEWLGVPRWMWMRYLRELAGLGYARLSLNADRQVRHRWELANLRGYFYEAWRHGRPTTTRVLITSHSGELGGMELRMAQEARYLHAAGYGCTLALRRFDGFDAWATQLAGEQVCVSEFSPPLFFEEGWRGRRMRLLRARWLAAQRLRAYRASLVHVAFCWTHYGASVLWLARHCGIPAVISVHNAFPPTAFAGWHQGLLRQAFLGVRGIYAVSESAMAHFLAIYRSYLPPDTRLAVIPNCVDVARFQPSPEGRRDARLRLGVPEHALVIGSVARLSTQKRPELTVALFALLVAAWPDLHLVLMGAGPLESQLRQQVRDLGLAERVIFTGFVPAAELLMPALDLHVLMSRNEGFGIATAEAMACGIPVVATDVPGSADILRGSAAGLLIPPDDLAASAAMVSALLADPERRAAMGRAGRAQVIERYSSAVVEQQIRTFYAGLL